MTPPAGRQDSHARRAAVIDVGSNSTLLLAVEVDAAGRARALEEALVTTRLGSGLQRGGVLAADARQRTREAVVELAARGRRAGAETVWGFATGAVREAADGVEFARLLADAAGIEVEILSGEAEARLAYDAVAAAFPGDRALLAVDIGGRSTELTLGRGAQIVTARSVSLGALALTEKTFGTDPPAEHELRAARSAIERELAATDVVSQARAAAARLAASGGTATALAALDLGLPQYEPRRVHGHTLSPERIAALGRARRPLPGIDPGRAAILPAGALILERVAALAAAAEIVISDHGVRHAYLRQRLAACGVVVDLRGLWP